MLGGLLGPVKSMPANFEWDADLQASEWDWREATGLGDLEVTLTPSEDFWTKFEELPDLGDDLESLFDLDYTNSIGGVLLNHDCMWSGTCLNKEHKSLQNGINKTPAISPTSQQPAQQQQLTPQPKPPVQQQQQQILKVANINPSPAKTKKRSVIVQKTVGRSVLINPRPRQPQQKTQNDISHRYYPLAPPRPDTPPSLSESEEDKGVSATEVTGQIRRTNYIQQKHIPTYHIQTNTNVKFEHNYDKQVRLDDLGVQTPSDSEEEEESSEEVEIKNEPEESDEEQVAEEEEEEGEEEEEEEEDEESEDDFDVNARETLPTNPNLQTKYRLQQKMANAISTTTLLSASRAVSRRLIAKKTKRKRRNSDSDDDYIDYEMFRRKSWRSPKKSRFSTDSETDTSEKRSLHNNMERMRRIDLRNSLDDLRSLIPNLSDNPKAPKVTILRDAKSYLHELSLKDRTLQSQVAELRRDQERLRATLSRLRRSLAVTRC